MQCVRPVQATGALLALAGAVGCLPRVVDPEAVEIELRRVAEGLVAPLALAELPDGSARLLIAQQDGVVVLAGPTVSDPVRVVLDLRDRLTPLNAAFDERGLLGLALHPRFSDNGRFFVYYTAPPGDDLPAGSNCEARVSEFRIVGDLPGADPAGERIVLRIAQPQSNHNGGQLAFGPDHCLYISTGDGGGAGDTGPGHTPGLGNAQDRSTLLGKVLRIDVDGAAPYAIPADNPFVGEADARAEIWAYGFRNPWRFSFDVSPAGHVRLFVGDVGQALREEVNLVERGGNYGWRVREGTLCFDAASPATPPAECPAEGADGEPLIDPIIEYDHRVGISVIGGYVYRGMAAPALRGWYIFGDYSTGFAAADGRVFAATQDESGAWRHSELSVAGRAGRRLGEYLLAFGRDSRGEMYILTQAASGPAGASGSVYRIVGAE